MVTLVQSLKDSFPKAEAGGTTPTPSPAGGVGPKTAKLTMPVKVSTSTKDLTLDTYAKQLQTWSDILEEILEYAKYQDLMESLKTTKEMKGLPKYVGEMSSS